MRVHYAVKANGAARFASPTLRIQARAGGFPHAAEFLRSPDRARTASPRRRRNRRRAVPSRRARRALRTNGNVIRFSRLRNTAAFSIRVVKSCIVSCSRCSTTSPGLMNIAIQRADEVARRQRLDLVDEGADAAALRVAEHHDVLYAQHLSPHIPAPPRRHGRCRPADRPAPDWRRCAPRTVRRGRRRKSLPARRGNCSSRSPSPRATGRARTVPGSASVRSAAAAR